MVKSEVEDKIMSMSEAVKKFVTDGCTLCLAGSASPSPYAAIHEVARQKKRDLTVVQVGSGMDIEVLAFTGLLKRFMCSYFYRAMGGERAFDRSVKKWGIQVEDYNHYSLVAMLMAGAMSLPFVPVKPNIVLTDIYRKRSFMGENKFKVVDNPFKPGEKVVLVPPLNPDVALVHVPRVDKYGNAQAWGPLSTLKFGAMACEKIIVSAEELVENQLVKLSPNYTIIPSYMVDAICIEPWGSHPTDLVGYYDVDFPFGMLYVTSSMADESFQEWIDEWVFGVSNRTQYIEHYIDKFGYPALERLKAKPYPTTTVNIGGTFQTYFEAFGITEEMLKKMPEFIEAEVE